MQHLLIADDHPLICLGIKSIVDSNFLFETVTILHNGADALEHIKNAYSGIAILDIDMGETSGLEIARYVYQNELAVPIVILTLYKERSFLLEALDSGVLGYLNKDSINEELLTCLDKVSNGERYIGKSMLSDDIDISGHLNDLVLIRRKINSLTQTELNIVQLIAEDKTSKDIAEQLFVSPKTIENHRGNICKKLELRGFNSLTKWIMENKFLIQKGLV